MKLSSLFLTLLVITSVTSCSKEFIEDESIINNVDVKPITIEDIMLSEQLVIAINTYRVSINLNSVILDIDTAHYLAMEHCNYMTSKDEASHHNFLSRSQRLRENGASSVSENVAYGYTNANSIVNAWINSPSHKATLEGDYNRIGIGFLNSETNTKYCTALFYMN